MGAEISITFQGRKRNLPRGLTIAGLVDLEGISRNESIVVLHNDIAVPPPSREDAVLHDGDVVEFFRFMGGG